MPSESITKMVHMMIIIMRPSRPSSSSRTKRLSQYKPYTLIQMFQNYIGVIETDPNAALIEALERTGCKAGGAKIVASTEIDNNVKNYTVKILKRHDAPEDLRKNMDWVDKESE